MDLKRLLSYGQIITMFIGSKDKFSVVPFDSYIQSHKESSDRIVLKRDYKITDIYPHFIEVIDKNGVKNTFNTGDLVMCGVLKSREVTT